MPTFTPPSMEEGCLIKFGVQKDNEEILYRLIYPGQINQEADAFVFLEEQAVRESLSATELSNGFSLEDYAVTLIFIDDEGDKVLIEDPGTLGGVLEECDKIKIIAKVEKRIKEPPIPPVRRDRNASVESATQTFTEPARRASTKEPLQDVVDAVVGILVSATNAVQTHLLEATAPDRRRVETRASPVVAASSGPGVAERSSQTPEPMEEEVVGHEEEILVPFIHGRHTCDGCLTTPIVGKRYHAVNLPDYDLCANCRDNYKGDNIKFEEAKLDRDRPAQERWRRRFSVATGDFSDEKSPEEREVERREARRGGRPSPAERRAHRRNCRPHGRCPPGPRGRHFGPPPFVPPRHHHHMPPYPPHMPPPAFGCPPFGCPPPNFPPPNGPSFPPPDSPFVHSPPPAFERFGIFGESFPKKDSKEDLALEEAIRRSIEDIKSKGHKDSSAKVPEPSAPLEEPKSVVVETISPEKQAFEDKTEEIMSSEESAKSASFATDAQGCGDVAADLGEALDKVATAIDSLNIELNRNTSDHASEDSEEEPDIVVSMDGVKEDAGAKIVDGEDDNSSGNSWHVVADENEMTTQDEALARAAQAIGSALFNSDMSRQEETISMLSQGSAPPASAHETVSSVSSVPSTVPSISTSHITPAQRDRWAVQLSQLHELGFYNDDLTIGILERLTAANIGSGETEEEVSAHRVVNEMMKDW